MNKNFVVYRSSAGSGKTYTLVREYLRLILKHENPYNYKHILAITFTNKATNEMKERVLKALREISEPNKNSYLAKELAKTLNISNEEIAKRASKAIMHMLHNYSDIHILTIDKFVYKVARSFAMELNLPMNLNIELNASDLIEVSVDKLLEQTGKNEETTELLLDFLKLNSRKDKTWKIENTIKSLSILLMQEDSSHFIPLIEKLQYQDFKKILKQVNETVSSFEKTVMSAGEKGLALIHENNVPINAFYYANSGGVPAYFKKCKAIKSKPASTLQPGSRLETTINEDKWTSGKATPADKADIDNIKIELVEYLTEIITIVSQQAEQYTLAKLLQETLYPMYLLSRVKESVFNISKQLQIVHISEFNKRISDVINKEPIPFIYERVGEKFHHFLIDEFQDTSLLQWNNLIPLVDESLSKGYYNMLVGDGKQAIYRWRGGEVEQFAKLPKLISNENHPNNHSLYAKAIESNFEAKNLGKNFRSKREIIQFNNFFFEELKHKLPEEFQNIYNDQSQLFDEKNTGGCVQIQKIEKDDILIKIKENIEECLKDGFIASDIAVLGKTNKQLVEISEYLLDQGIAVKSSESLLLNQDINVLSLISFMNWVTNPNSKEKRTVLAAHLQKINQLTESSVLAIIDNDEALKLFLEQRFNLIYSEVIHLSLYELAHQVAERLLKYDGSDRFLSAMLDLVFQYQIKNQSSVFGFLNYWESKKAKLSVQSPENVNAVQLLTVHKSKGLEFPIVILPGVNWENKKSGSRISYRWVKNEENTYTQLKYFLLPLKKELSETAYKNVLEAEQKKEILDDFNVLYVAFTRPVHRLYVSYSSEKGIAKYFSKHLESSEYWNSETNLFCLGEASKKEMENTDKQEDIPDYSFEKANWNKVIKLSYEHKKSEINKKTNYGTLIHNMLDGIEHLNDVINVVQKQIVLGTLPEEDRAIYEDKLKEIITHPDLVSYFSEENEIQNETEICLSTGEVVRPDKIVFNKQQATIIDYKTGKPSSQNKQQMVGYINAVKDLGYKNVAGILFYTETLQAVNV